MSAASSFGRMTEPSPPETLGCEFCELRATVAVERRKGRDGKFGTGQYIYACTAHERLARAAADALH